MGNETSSVKIHTLLSADDLKALRGNFPGGPEPVNSLYWSPWKQTWPEYLRSAIESLLRSPDKSLNFQAYQELAGSVVRGTPEDRTKLIFKILNPQNDPSTSSIKASSLLGLMEDILDILGRHLTQDPGYRRDESVPALAQGLLHDLVFSGKPRKACLLAKPETDPVLDFDQVERWMVMIAPLFDSIWQHVLAKSFALILTPNLIPASEIALSGTPNTRLRPAEVVFLNSALPLEFRTKWRLQFNSRIHGESFAKMSAAILNKGPTLMIVWEKHNDDSGDHVFGAFASESWKIGPKFYGSPQNFLFSLRPRSYLYESTTFNTNYQYMNVKAKTLPNGVGFGGQLDYFGLWIDAEYGKARCAPSCSSYQSPQLSREEYFLFHHMEVWAVGEEPRDDDDEVEGARSALDLDPEAQAVMEMMGKTFVSKDVRAQDEQEEKNKKDLEKAKASEAEKAD